MCAQILIVWHAHVRVERREEQKCVSGTSEQEKAVDAFIFVFGIPRLMIDLCDLARSSINHFTLMLPLYLVQLQRLLIPAREPAKAASAFLFGQSALSWGI